MVDVAVPSIATVNPNAGDTVLGVQDGLVRRFPVGTGNGLAREDDLANATDPSKGPGMLPFDRSLSYAINSIAAAVKEALKTTGELNLPDQISSIFPYSVELLPGGRGSTRFDITAFRPSGKKYYVSHTGSNSNSGLSTSAPLQTIAAALAKTDVDEIVLFPGEWPRNIAAWNFATVTRNILLTVLNGGSATIYGSDFEGAQSWAADATYSNVFLRARSSVLSVYDSKYKNNKGDFTLYQLKASVAEVSVSPGSYYTDGVNVYVRLIDDRAPDNDLRVNLSTVCSINGSGSLYAENISFLGVTVLVRSNSGTLVQPKFYGHRCRFAYGHFDGLLGSGSFMSEGGITYLVECETYRSKRDGNSYHPNSLGEVVPFALELDCVTRDNGLSSEDNDNGSTMHGGGRVLRINTYASNSRGPNIADVGAGTVSYNVGCRAKNSYMATSRNFEIQGRPEGLAYMYLVGCSSEGSRQYDARVRPDGYEGYLYHYGSNIVRSTGAVSFIKEFYPISI